MVGREVGGGGGGSNLFSFDFDSSLGWDELRSRLAVDGGGEGGEGNSSVDAVDGGSISVQQKAMQSHRPPAHKVCLCLCVR